MKSRSKILTVFEFVEKNQENSLEFLQELISFKTEVGGSYEDIQQAIAKKLSSLGAKIDIWEPDIVTLKQSPWFRAPLEYYPHGFKQKPIVVGRLPGTGGGRSLILNGHVEVVTPGPLELWASDPWKGTIRDGRMYGRGVIDCKGGLAAAIQALEAISKAGIQLGGDILLESVIDEEIGGTGTLAAILRGYRADAGIVTEPTHRKVIIARPGVMWFRVTVRGKSAHAAHVWQGVNAIEKALKVHKALCDYGENRMQSLRHPLFEDFPIHATFNPGTFRAGGYPSSVPDECILEYRIGTLPGENNDKVLEEIKSLIATEAEKDTWLKSHPPELTLFGWYGLPYELDPKEPIIRSLSTCYEYVYGQPPPLRGATANNDSWMLNAIAKIPTVTLGNTGGNYHQNDEFILLEDYQNLIKIFVAAMIEWCCP
jgi:acetylornithine deacetylase